MPALTITVRLLLNLNTYTLSLFRLATEVHNQIPIDSDHSNLVKLSGRIDPNYLAVRSKMKEMIKKAPEILSERGRSKTRAYFMVPFSKNEQYIRRSQKFTCLENELIVNTSGHRRLALWGLGGVGKTQDVLDFVYQFKDSKVSVFWIHAGSTTRFEQDYRKLAKLIGLPGHGDPKQDIRPIVKNWLERPESGDWVIMLDNADNKLDFFPEGGVSVHESMACKGLAQFIPQGSNGTVIVTTRDREVADQLACMNVLSREAMNVGDEMQLFKQHYPRATEYDDGSVLQLLKALQYLPLEIVQVAAFLCINTLFSLSEYLKLFNSTRDAQKRLLSRPFRDLQRDANSETILTTFSITFRQVQQQSPLAGSLLKPMACIDCQGIPHELLLRSGLEGCNNEIALAEALSKLVNFSLLTTSEHGKTYEMHSLIHISAEAFLPPQE
ncbi:hypothetical protein K440DRAFT_642735 [Wilcoxina mikolae CBS 423.85]|nr:hypothetical protein K440DRAFT_642735 [Wilcoxina mikolae CBS 423.85]